MRKLSVMNKILCCLTAVFLLLAVPAISEAGNSSKKLNCKTSGTFLTGFDTAILGAATFAAASVGMCNRGFGQVGTLGIFETIALATPTFDCIELGNAASGPGGNPGIIYNKKGDSVLYAIGPGAFQCFTEADGLTAVDPAGGFCGGPGTAHFSTSTVPFTIIPGSTGKFAGATGGGTFTSTASHCDTSKPVANFVDSVLKNGTLTVP